MRGRRRRSTRLWVEGCAVSDIASLRDKWGAALKDLAPERWCSPSVTLIVTWDDGRTKHETVRLTATKPRFGGWRWWYVCPGCGRRAGKLYATDDLPVLCRLCLGLAYECQYRKNPLLVYARWLCKEPNPAYEKRWSRALWKAVERGRLREEWALRWEFNPGPRRPSLALLRRLAR